MKRTFKKIVSLALVVVMIVSTMAISVISTSALSFPKKYTVYIRTAGNQGRSLDTFKFKINSIFTSEEIKITMFGRDYIRTEFERDLDMGMLQTIEIEHCSGCDDLYINYIDVIEPNGKTTSFYGGRWISDEVVTLQAHDFNRTDNVYKLSVNTSDVKNAGTDADVILFPKNSSGKVIDEINLTNLSASGNSFERNTTEEFYVYLPEKLNDVSVKIKTFGIFVIGCSWHLNNIEVEQVSGIGSGTKTTFEFNDWIEDNTDYFPSFVYIT